MELKDIIIVILIGCLLALGIVMIVGKSDDSLGGSTSDDWDVGGNSTVAGTFDVDGATTLDGVTVAEDLVVNNLITAGALSVSSGSFTLTASQVCDNASLLFTVNSAATLTTPSSASFGADCLDTVGDGWDYEVHNLTASAQAITLSAGTGIDMGLASSSGSSVVIGQDESALLKFRKLNSGSISLDVLEFQ